MTQNLRAGLVELAGEARPVDLRDRVLKGSRRMAIRQRVAGGAMATVALAGMIGALMLMRTDGEVKPPVESPTPTLASPSAPPSPSIEPVLPVDIRNATFVVPDFPGAEDCPAGTRKFVNGRADANPNGDPEPTTLIQLGKPTVADVDGVPGAEILTIIGCRGYAMDGQVLALKVSPGGALSPLGFVLRSPDHPSFEVDSNEPIVVRDGVVEVTLLSPGVPDGGHRILDLQVRGYRFQDGSFRQVSGPTKFAAAPEDPAKTDMANATVNVVTAKWWDYVKLVNGSGQAQINGTVYSVTMVRSEFMADPTTGIVLYRIEDPGGVVTETIVVYTFSIGNVPADHSFAALESGQDGIAHINTFDATGRQVKVTVALSAGGTEVRIYREKTNAQGWERVS